MAYKTTTDSDTPENVAQTVATLMANMPGAEVLGLDETARTATQPLLIAVPDGIKIIDQSAQLHAAAQLMKPYQRKGTAKMADLPSLIAWANRFKAENSVLFGKNTDNDLSLTCIADYHLEGPATITDAGDPTARYGSHRASYTFPLSKAWKLWKSISGNAQTSVEMGAFLEDNILDVIDPPLSLTSPGIAGAEATESEHRLIDIARRLDGSYGTGFQLFNMAKSFSVYESSEFVEQRNLTTGEATLVHKSEHVDGTGQPIKIPKLFLIAIPVFEGGPAYRLPVRFQYRKSGSVVKFTLTLHDPKNALDHAFDEATATAATETGMPLFIGTPEN